MRFLIGTLIVFCVVQFCSAQAPNTLTSNEKEEGWKLLFDGENIEGWHIYGKKGLGPAWIIKDHALTLSVPNKAGNKAEGGGDIVTDRSFSGDFEFKIDWKISSYGNSGVFFFVSEKDVYPNLYDTGLELQFTDNKIYEDAEKDNKKRAGDLFGVISTGISEVNPANEWNQVHVVFKNRKLDIFMNGFQIHELDLNSEFGKEIIAKSFLKSAPIGKGDFQGRIGLQDWGSEVAFRNIKYRVL